MIGSLGRRHLSADLTGLVASVAVARLLWG